MDWFPQWNGVTWSIPIGKIIYKSVVFDGRIIYQMGGNMGERLKIKFLKGLLNNCWKNCRVCQNCQSPCFCPHVQVALASQEALKPAVWYPIVVPWQPWHFDGINTPEMAADRLVSQWSETTDRLSVSWSTSFSRFALLPVGCPETGAEAMKFAIIIHHLKTGKDDAVPIGQWGTKNFNDPKGSNHLEKPSIIRRHKPPKVNDLQFVGRWTCRSRLRLYSWSGSHENWQNSPN